MEELRTEGAKDGGTKRLPYTTKAQQPITFYLSLRSSSSPPPRLPNTSHQKVGNASGIGFTQDTGETQSSEVLSDSNFQVGGYGGEGKQQKGGGRVVVGGGRGGGGRGGRRGGRGEID